MPRSGGCLVFIWFARKEIEPEWSAYLVESLDDRLAADYSKPLSPKKTPEETVVEAGSFFGVYGVTC